MKHQAVGYIRISSIDQNPERQLQELILDKKFIDVASGSCTNRPQLKLCMDYLREADILYIDSIDRLARNLKDLQDIINCLLEKGVIIKFLKEQLSFSNSLDPIANLTLHLMGAFAEFERTMIRTRQREGLELAKKKGVRLGRPPMISKSAKEKAIKLKNEGMSIRKIAFTLNLSRVSIYKILGIPLGKNKECYDN